MVKHAAAGNVLYIESKIGQKLALESGLIPHLLSYTARMLNLYRRPKGSAFTPFERMRDRPGEGSSTYPFGCTMIGKPVDSSMERELEQLTHLVYVGPASTVGGGNMGFLARGSRVGVSDERLN